DLAVYHIFFVFMLSLRPDATLFPYTTLFRSGCGKTTLLRIIAGLEAPDEGTVEFDGHNITKIPAEKRGFGVVFQNYALFPHLNRSEEHTSELQSLRNLVCRLLLEKKNK